MAEACCEPIALKPDDFCKCQYRPVPSGHGVIFRGENMRSSSASSLALIVEAYVRMCAEDHVARAIDNVVSRVSGAVIQNLVDGFICALYGRSLL